MRSFLTPLFTACWMATLAAWISAVLLVCLFRTTGRDTFSLLPCPNQTPTPALALSLPLSGHAPSV